MGFIDAIDQLIVMTKIPILSFYELKLNYFTVTL